MTRLLVKPSSASVSDPAVQKVLAWLQEVFFVGQTGSLLKGTVYKEYLRACADKKWKPFSGPTLGRLVHKAFPGIDTKRKGPRGRAKYHYENLNYIDPQLNREKQYKSKKQRRKMKTERTEWDSDSSSAGSKKASPSRSEDEHGNDSAEDAAEEDAEQGDETGPPPVQQSLLLLAIPQQWRHDRYLRSPHDESGGSESDPMLAAAVRPLLAAAPVASPPQPLSSVPAGGGMTMMSDWASMARVNYLWECYTTFLCPAAADDDPFDAVKAASTRYYESLREELLAPGGLDADRIQGHIRQFWEREWPGAGAALDHFWGSRMLLVCEQEGLDRLNVPSLLPPRA